MDTSFTVTPDSLIANGIRQSFCTAGAPGAPALVLLHGLGWTAVDLWSRLMPDVARRGWRVVAPDLRGVGGSAPLDRPYRITDYADDIAALLAALNIGPVVLVGFSMGGMVATALAARRSIGVRGLALCGASLVSSGEDARAVEAMLARAVELGPLAFAREQAGAIWHPGWAEVHPAEVEAFIARRSAMDQQGLAHAFRAPFGCDLRDAFAALDMPLAVIAATDDPFLPVANAAAISRLNPRAGLALIEDAGHMFPIERPEAFRMALDCFLSSLPEPVVP